eukprot:6692087-Alexandrium_andersonii.AAC.1
MPTISPAWGFTANLAIFAARMRFIGCRRLGGLSTGDSIVEGAKLHGRHITRLADSRLAVEEAQMANLVDELLNE